MAKQNRNFMVAPVLYGLVRTNLPSMNPGKGMAQIHHAGVQMVAKYPNHPLVKEYISQGIRQGADNFNTTITLDATKSDIDWIETQVTINKMVEKKTCLYGKVIDPSYPFLMNADEYEFFRFCKIPGFTGKYISPTQVACTRPELTVAWFLGDMANPAFKGMFAKLNLYP